MAIGTAIAIGAAIKAGVSLGEMGSSFIYKYTQNEYQKKVSELEELHTELKGHLETLLDLRRQMASFWRDEHAQKTGAVLDINIQKVRNNMQTVDDLIRIYKEAVNSIGGSNNVMDEVLGAAGSILDSVAE